MLAFIAEGIDCHNAQCWRSYRADLKDNPAQYITAPGVPVEILKLMDQELMGVQHAYAST